MHIFVIGAGPSGLTAAITAARHNNNHKVTIIEKNNKIGKKLLLTGNGRCNFYNDNQALNNYHTNNSDILSKILFLEKNNILDFINSLGIVHKSINGYYYPYSNQSTSIVNALYQTASKLNIEFKFEEQVISIIKENDFIIKTNKTIYHSDKVILSCGSKALPKTGSDGSGYELAKSLGHSLITPLPALVQLNGDDSFYKEWAGIRAEVILNYYENKKFIQKEHGEVQLTNYGISGICAMNLSSQIARGLTQNNIEEISINFVPWISNEKELINYLNQKERELCYNLTELLEGFLNYKIVNLILKLAHISPKEMWSKVSKQDVVNLLMNFPFKVTSTNDFNNSQVCSGGIPLSEINPYSMESLITENLYLVGEILDVDGICGGYNLSFAWMSGLIAGRSAAND